MCIVPLFMISPFIVSADSSQVYAQTFERDMEAMIKNMDLSQRAPVSRGALTAPLVLPANLDVHWRLWRQVVSGGQWTTAPLEGLRNDSLSLGYHSLPVHAMGVVATSRSPEVRALGSTRVQEYYFAAQALAPDLPYPYLDHAAYLFKEDPAAIPTALRAYFKGIEKSWTWLDTRAALELNLVRLALMAMLISAFLFLFTQLMRYFGIAAYDSARALPRGFSSNQTVVLLVALVVVPGLIAQSPLLSLIILLATISVFQQTDERVITVLIFACLALLPLADRHMSTLLTYPGSEAQTLLHAQYIHCDARCIDDLEGRVQSAEVASDALRYTYWLARARTGQPSLWPDLLEEMENHRTSSTQAMGYIDNLRGAVLIAQGKPDEAIPVLESARQNLPASSAAASYNLMRAYQLTDEEDAAERARAEALSRDLYGVLARSRVERRDINSMLILEPMATSILWELHRAEPKASISLVQPAWRALAGENIPLDGAFFLGILGAFIALGGVGLRLSGRTSTPCPRCGLARDPEDSERMGHHHYCHPCYRTFVSPEGFDYEARVHNEAVLGRRAQVQTIMRRFFSLILPGTGHALAGQALLGFTVLLSLSFFAIGLLQPTNLWRSPFEFFTLNPYGEHVLSWIVIALCLLTGLLGAWRDIAPTVVAKPKSRGPK